MLTFLFPLLYFTFICFLNGNTKGLARAPEGGGSVGVFNADHFAAAKEVSWRRYWLVAFCKRKIIIIIN